MESKILAGVLQSDTHTRLQAGEQLLEYLRDEGNQLGEFEDLEELIKGLANWMSSSNFRVSGRTCTCSSWCVVYTSLFQLMRTHFMVFSN